MNPPDGGLRSWATNWRVAGEKRSLVPQSTRSGIDDSAGSPKTVFRVQSSKLSNALRALPVNDWYSPGLTAQIPAVRCGPNRAPSNNAPYQPIDQPINPTREMSRPLVASIGISSLSTIAPESSPLARWCQ